MKKITYFLSVVMIALLLAIASQPQKAKAEFYGDINAEFAIAGNTNLVPRIGGGVTFDLGYIIGNNRFFINSGVHYLSGKPADYDILRHRYQLFSFVHVPLTLNYGIVLNAGRVSFIPSLGFGYSFTTMYGYDIETDGRALPFPAHSFIVSPKLQIMYNFSDKTSIGATFGGNVFASEFLKFTYMVVGFTASTKF